MSVINENTFTSEWNDFKRIDPNEQDHTTAMRISSNLEDDGATPISLDSDLGLVARVTFAEMRGGSDADKSIVAESVVNRANYTGTQESSFGTGSISQTITASGAYAATSDGINSPLYDDPMNGTGGGASNSVAGRVAWEGSLKAAYNALNGHSNVSNGAHYYNTGSTYSTDNPQAIDAPAFLDDNNYTRTIAQPGGRTNADKVTGAWRLDD